MRVRYGLWLLLLAFPPVWGGEPAPCDPALTPERGKGAVGYLPRGPGRCEGFYLADHYAGGGLRLTHLARGELNFSRKSAGQRLSSPLKRTPIQVRGVATPPKTYYRLDLRIPPGATVSWPTGEVIRRVGLEADDIGLYGFLPHRPEIHLPVVLESDEELQMRVISSRRLTTLYWRHVEAPDARCGPMPEAYRELYSHNGFDAGREIELELPEVAANGLCVEMAGLTSRGEWLQRTWRIRTRD